MSKKNQNSIKYKHTRSLLKIAREQSGYTFAEIAKKAGLSTKSSSQVSRWVNGQSHATQRQMSYFIKNYGHILSRAQEHLFYQCLGKADENLTPTFIKLRGEIVFKYTLKETLRTGNERSTQIPLFRFLVLRHDEQYQFLILIRAGVLEDDKVLRQDGEQRVELKITLPSRVKSDNEWANWYMDFISDSVDEDDLISLVRTHCRNLNARYLVISRGYSPNRNLLRSKTIAAFEFSFYQKMLSLGLKSEQYPF